jgi:DNA polymerase (family 10)
MDGDIELNQEAQPQVQSNAEIADRLASLAQLLSTQKENAYKAKAYRRAAARIRTLGESLDQMVREGDDLTRFPSIGEGIAAAIREIVLTGSLGKLETLRGQATPALAGLSDYARLDPRRVLRIYKKLGIASVPELKEQLDNGAIEKVFGLRMAQHVRQGLTETRVMLLYHADDLRDAIEAFLTGPCGARRVEAAGDYRRRVEVIDELVFLVEADDFAAVVARLQRYGGRTPLLSSETDTALFALSSGIRLRLQRATEKDWGFHIVACTGAKAHLRKLAALAGPLRQLEPDSFPAESGFYREFGLAWIPPELREGRDEVRLAKAGRLPNLVTPADLRGDLHAHTVSSDGSDSIEAMAEAARERGYEYLGISDHSQSLKIARGLPVEDLWAQIRLIDRLNAKLRDFRILKSSEVDILSDGALDYPDDLLQELDYTVCSIHSHFAAGREAQTERILRAMDNRHFHILGHATGRLLLKRPGYEIDIGRIIDHARQNGCFFEINSSPDRLDLPAEYARQAAAAGVMVAISTDSHSTRELGLIRCGLDQARRAGLERSSILNCRPWRELQYLFRR